MFYLYFVLPPVIIVISLALIIFLVSRKSLDIEKKITESNGREVGSLLSREVKSRGLSFLEKIAHLFKIFSLKTHNWLEEKLRFIRQRKEKIKANNKNNNNFENNKNNFFDENKVSKNVKNVFKKFFRKEKRYGEVSKEKKESKIKNGEKQNTSKKSGVTERRAMISEKVVLPGEKKEELENILIERIAVDPRDIEAYERLGDYYVGQSNYDDARECYKQVLKLNPHSASVKNKLESFK